MPDDTTIGEVDIALSKAWMAFHQYRNSSVSLRAKFMRTIGEEIQSLGDGLIEVAANETNLPVLRLQNERARTIFQLNSYGAACEEGSWLEARIDTGIPDKTPPKPDLRKMLTAIGPVVVFGASNFPFAYSTAGGDTACAFAAGCPVIVKAHPAHPKTSDLVAKAIKTAIIKCELPEGIFSHVHGSGNETGKALVMHEYTRAVGFTGSFSGGKALFDWANQRKVPIPVFSEMGSVNPVFLLNGKLSESPEDLAKQLAGSITLGTGQFCTNPGLVIGIDGESLNRFILSLGDEIKKVSASRMLHPGIAKNFSEKRQMALAQESISVVAEAEHGADETYGAAVVAEAPGSAFLKNTVLHQEVFGPYSLVVKCSSKDEMLSIAKNMEGQLTTSLMATSEDLQMNNELVEAVKNICGRMILNNVPTGVEVCLSMQHGGPYPATTDSRFTSVGADGIKRFARPLCYQNWQNDFLPDELKNENPLGIWRTINNNLTKDPIR